MKAIKTGLKALGVAFILVIVGGIAGFMSSAYLEIWFDTVDGVEASDPSTWHRLAKGLAAKVDFTSPRLYRVYYGENMNDDTRLSTADVKLKNFGITNRLGGIKTKEDGRVFDLLGFSNADNLVLAQRSDGAGLGLFWLKDARSQGQLLYFGYYIAQDQRRPGETERWVTQCPVVVMTKSNADKSYARAEDAKNAFPFLKTKCVEFKLPVSMAVEVVAK
jgi:hypothetical protein